MAVLDIALMGDPILACEALPVEDPGDGAVVRLVADMVETMLAAGGVGLAAPQVRHRARLVIFQLPPGRSADGRGVPLTVLINPRIEPLTDDMDPAYEACLSVPGLTGVVPRWRRIGYRAWDLDGRLVEREAEGLHARVVQHECDHLSGLLYLSRMQDLSSLAMTAELHRQAALRAKENT
ncbi:MAG TPA: peptide deformylase [Rhodospirillaceae bacterium]|nr:peptide deformylase [Rhodospirillaceae bacterium]